MTDTNDMIHIAQSKFKKLIRQNTCSIREPKKRMIRKHRPQPHSPSMQYGLMTQTAQACMPMHDFDLLSEYNIPKYRKERKDSRESGFSIDDEERNMVDLEAVRKVSNAGSSFIRMSDDDDLVAAVDEFGRELIDVAFNAAGLGEKEVADHRNVVRHLVSIQPSVLGVVWLGNRTDTL